MIATSTLSAAEHPKQVKLLGATVEGLGVVVAVSQRLTWGTPSPRTKRARRTTSSSPT